MAILQDQNEELEVKRKMAKQKEKARRSRPKKLNKIRQGLQGGLLLIWDDDLFKANNCYKGERWLCVERVMMKNNFNCAVCLVYGAHEREEKRVVWEELSYVVGLCQLVDLSLNDRKFTWFRGRSCSRIDRVLVNIEWVEEFPDVRLKGGPRGLSDHYVQFTSKLKALAGLLRLWHKNNFGNMEKRLQTLEEEIKKLDNMVCVGVYDVRRRNNRIDALMIHGRVVRNQTRIKVAIRGFYKGLYRQELVPRIGFRDGLVRQIDGAEAVALEVMPSVEEIRGAVWDCESSKAPGSDGYNLNFIKRCWEDIGQEFTTAVMDFFQSAKLPADVNVTWVTLAPKFVGAKETRDFRPISMVGCV
ncbi:uncharacterized protein LOC130974943 [Arachis stenosperma]|uniref:uncharacterized protein LOC130974943 n=1 Tax=Arachis stenosperma TaxID=217475 RepID=UPI0025AD76DD|nr:uncharacterized protein LOC130974943 [Arachis stenosperma]